MITTLTAEKLTVQRGSRRLVEGLSFTVKAGQALALEGANGAGKTSLLRLIAGFLPAAAGAVTLLQDDREISEPEERGRFVGWLGHHDALKASFTVSEQLTFFGKLYGRSGDGTTLLEQAHLLEQIGLTRQAELPCRYLSAGQRRRLALCGSGVREKEKEDEDEGEKKKAGRERRGERVGAKRRAGHGGRVREVVSLGGGGGRCGTLAPGPPMTSTRCYEIQIVI